MFSSDELLSLIKSRGAIKLNEHKIECLMNNRILLIFTGQSACNEDTVICLEESKDLSRDERNQHQGQHASFYKQVPTSEYPNKTLDSYFRSRSFF